MERRVLKLIRQTTAGTGGGHDEPFFKVRLLRRAVCVQPLAHARAGCALRRPR